MVVFVFGSNLSGIHGAGAAKYAHKTLGAPYGKGEGFHSVSMTYALPTKGLNISTMALDEVRAGVNRFLSFAESRPDLDFKVTQVGCGLGGFTKEEIAPMFVDAPSNCLFDFQWESILGKDKRYWGTF